MISFEYDEPSVLGASDAFSRRLLACATVANGGIAVIAAQAEALDVPQLKVQQRAKLCSFARG